MKTGLGRSRVPSSPFPQAKADLKIVMGYRLPGEESRAAIEVHPVAGVKASAAAKGAGLVASTVLTLLVECENRPGLGHAMAKAIADANVNLNFVLAQVVGRRYSAVFGFENDSDAARASALVLMAAAPRRQNSPTGRALARSEEFVRAEYTLVSSSAGTDRR